MASCSNCSHMVSPQARFCPSCGHPEPARNSGEGAIAAVVLMVLAAAFLSPALLVNHLLDRFPGDLWDKTLSDPASWIGSTAVWIVIAVRRRRARSV